MITDSQTNFSTAQVLNGAGNYPSTNTLDFTVARDLAEGRDLWIVNTVDVAGVNTGTYQINLQTDVTTAFSTTVILASYTLQAADILLGAQIVLPMPFGVLRYMRTAWALGGTSPAITVTTNVVEDIQRYRKLPSGFSIS